ncbi:MAG: hypothetical protein OD918_04095 [Gammaproteobacteria bacterium]
MTGRARGVICRSGLQARGRLGFAARAGKAAAGTVTPGKVTVLVRMFMLTLTFMFISSR